MSPLLLAAAEPGLELAVRGGGSSAVKLFLLMTVLSFASALLVSVTSFTRIIIETDLNPLTGMALAS